MSMSSEIVERSVTFEGMDCLADTMQSAYKVAYKALQAEIPWAAQAEYGKYTVYFGAVTIFVALIKNYWYILADWRYTRNVNVSNLPGILSSIIAVLTAYSRYVGYKPLNRKLCRLFALPETTGSTLFILSSTLYLALYAFLPHFWYRACRGFGSPPLMVRCGIMATALTPFIFILSGKSNLITLLTGISYEKLNVFHQYTGVMALILGLIHTIGFIWQDHREGGAHRVATQFSKFSYYSGIPPMVLLIIICVSMNSWIRKYCYEWLLHIHWASGVAYFATLWWHIDNLLNCEKYMYASLAFWATQLLYRLFVKTCFKPNRYFLKPRPATLTKISDNTYEVLVTNAEGYSWGPGQHCFLRFAGSKILDNHPFSICLLPAEENDSSMLKFIIVPKKGLTQQLYTELDTSVSIQKKVFLDGPYGGTSREPFAFDNVSLYSSGSGVTVALPYLTYLARSIVAAKKEGKDFVTKDIHFVWIARYEDHYNWIKDELDNILALAGDYITIDFYVAKRVNHETISEKMQNQDGLDMEKGPTSMSSSVQFPKQVNVHYEKPNFKEVVFQNKHHIKRKSMFVSSGSGSMRDDVASGVSELQTMIFNTDVNGRRYPVEEIYLHSEAFGW